MRDCFRHASRVQSRSPLKRRRVLHELGDSRTEEPEFAGEQETPHVRGPVFGQFDSYVCHRLAQSPALPPGSRNRGHKNQPDAAAGICSPQNYGSAGGAREDVPTWSDASSNIEHGSRRHFRLGQFIGKVELTPHLSPLPLSKGRGAESSGAGQSRTEFGPPNPRDSERVPTLMSISEPFTRRPVAIKSSASVSLAQNCGASRRHALPS